MVSSGEENRDSGATETHQTGSLLLPVLYSHHIARLFRQKESKMFSASTYATANI